MVTWAELEGCTPEPSPVGTARKTTYVHNTIHSFTIYTVCSYRSSAHSTAPTSFVLHITDMYRHRNCNCTQLRIWTDSPLFTAVSQPATCRHCGLSFERSYSCSFTLLKYSHRGYQAARTKMKTFFLLLLVGMTFLINCSYVYIT